MTAVKHSKLIEISFRRLLVDRPNDDNNIIYHSIQNNKNRSPKYTEDLRWYTATTYSYVWLEEIWNTIIILYSIRPYGVCGDLDLCEIYILYRIYYYIISLRHII